MWRQIVVVLVVVLVLDTEDKFEDEDENEDDSIMKSSCWLFLGGNGSSRPQFASPNAST
jgi:hypothetical protein